MIENDSDIEKLRRRVEELWRKLNLSKTDRQAG
jgi:hypothetical protein